MNKEVKEFLDSGKLEEYLMGTCDQQVREKVEYFINTYPEVKTEYDSLQNNIEEMAKKLALKTPIGLKEAIVSCLEDDDCYEVKSKLTKIPESNSNPSGSILRFLPWAAAIVAIVTSVSLFNQNHSLRNQNMEIHAQHNLLQARYDAQELELASLSEKLFISGHDKTARLVMAGNNLSPDFQTTAFYNNVAGKAILYVNNLGAIDTNHCYQVWADVDGKMVNMGILPHKQGAYELKFLDKASSINITIEPKGGSDHPTVSKIISSEELIKI